MLNYKFPQIETIDDVLPHIEGYDEFVVGEREWGTVINYVVSTPDTFTMTGLNDLSGAIRRECRGIKFGLDGKIVARPLHKFFNVNEREETQMSNIDLTQSHSIYPKFDGSMVHPIRRGNGIIMLTKMGDTDQGKAATHYAYDYREYRDFCVKCIDAGVTPIFEWVSPRNRIVVKYEQDALPLLAVRDNITGEYLDNSKIRNIAEPEVNIGVPLDVKMLYTGHDYGIEKIVKNTRALIGEEGYIIRWDNGHMVKIKADEYVRIHKAKDQIRYNRNIAALVLNNELDDLIPMLPEEDKVVLLEYQRKFEDGMMNTIHRIKELYEENKHFDRKTIAVERSKNISKADMSILFRVLDGKDPTEQVVDTLVKATSSNAKWDIAEKWVGIKTA